MARLGSRRLLVAGVMVGGAIVVAVLLARGDRNQTSQGGGERFQLALIGDARYRPDEYPKFQRLQERINAEGVAFTIHVGDIKGGGSCADRVYQETLEIFNGFASPLIYTPGDNEWTDCGDRRPRERLAFLRRVFFAGEQSQGRERLRLERQSRDYPENARWQFANVTFATLHVVGSNNNRPDPSRPEGTLGDAEEYTARNTANLEWLAQTFQKARAGGSLAVVLAMQADPAFERPPGQRPGYEDLLAALERETVAFAKPVVLVHGDSHVSRIDKPLVSRATGGVIENFTRVETFGSPDVHWVRGTVDTQDPKVFTFSQELIEANREP
ncbi:MAG: metallophosphoesterase [Actinomycetota bacterium]|nr:metallophosphoesterase [Actinomycetota bacterium]MDQ3574129.1 metallophosphoesterase [Actinomycetota bacterium]